MTISLPVVVTSALADALNPCAFSVLLSFLAVLFTGAALGQDVRPRVWTAGGAYVSGMFVAYLLLGLGILTTVSFLSETQLPVRLMAIAVVIAGLWTLKDVALPGVGPALMMPGRWHAGIRRALAWGTPAGLFTAGGLVGLCTLPCTGAIYMGVLAAITREPLRLRVPYLLVYDVAFVAPLIILLAVTGSRRVLNLIAHAYMQKRSVFKAVAGTIAVALGFAILVTA